MYFFEFAKSGKESRSRFGDRQPIIFGMHHKRGVPIFCARIGWWDGDGKSYAWHVSKPFIMGMTLRSLRWHPTRDFLNLTPNETFS